MTLEQIIPILCWIYFIGVGIFGYAFSFDYVRSYPWVDPRNGTLALLGLILAPALLGLAPFILIGTYAIALAHTRVMEKRKGR